MFEQGGGGGGGGLGRGGGGRRGTRGRGGGRAGEGRGRGPTLEERVKEDIKYTHARLAKLREHYERRQAALGASFVLFCVLP